MYTGIKILKTVLLTLIGITLSGLLINFIVNGNLWLGLAVDIIIGIPAIWSILWLSRYLESLVSANYHNKKINSYTHKMQYMETGKEKFSDPTEQAFLSRLIIRNKLIIKAEGISREMRLEEGKLKPDKDLLNRLNKESLEVTQQAEKIMLWGENACSEEERAFELLRDSYNRMSESAKIGFVLSETEVRGVLECDVKDCSIGYNSINGLNISALCLSDYHGMRKIFILPQFIIVVSHQNDIDAFDIDTILNKDLFKGYEVYPLNYLNLKCKKFKYRITDNIVPSDSKLLGYSYKHINKDGSRDCRYSDNPSVPLVEMAQLSESRFGLTFWISRADDAMQFCHNYESLYSLQLKNSKEDKSAPFNSSKTVKRPETTIKKPSAAKIVPEHHAKSSAQQLSGLVGLNSVKKEFETINNFARIQSLRASQGLKCSPVSYHCVFTGNPGTGKTTAARILADIFKENGVLQKGHLIETDRAGLVAEYVGQTAIKTNNIINSALDGVLFIDEAYTLISGSKNDFGNEAIATLLKRMEDDRDRLVVVLAGYSDEMKQFISSNPGLESRFTRYIDFPDYTEDELYEIFSTMVNSHGYKIDVLGEEAVKLLIHQRYINKDENFGNARFVRNIFESIMMNQANRLSTQKDITSHDLQLINDMDVVPLFK